MATAVGGVAEEEGRGGGTEERERQWPGRREGEEERDNELSGCLDGDLELNCLDVKVPALCLESIWNGNVDIILAQATPGLRNRVPGSGSHLPGVNCCYRTYLLMRYATVLYITNKMDYFQIAQTILL